MSNNPTLTAEEKIQFIAEKILGWKTSIVNPGYDDAKGNLVWSFKNQWNPLEDWNHWRMVEEKILEDEKLTKRVFLEFWKPYHGKFTPSHCYMKSTLEQRIDALIKAYLSIYPE